MNPQHNTGPSSFVELGVITAAFGLSAPLGSDEVDKAADGEEEHKDEDNHEDRGPGGIAPRAAAAGIAVGADDLSLRHAGGLVGRVLSGLECALLGVGTRPGRADEKHSLGAVGVGRVADLIEGGLVERLEEGLEIGAVVERHAKVPRRCAWLARG